MNIKKRIWISYDLGIIVDYENFYQWLDEQNAKECGLNVATFELEIAEENLVGYLRESIVLHLINKCLFFILLFLVIFVL